MKSVVSYALSLALFGLPLISASPHLKPRQSPATTAGGSTTTLTVVPVQSPATTAAPAFGCQHEADPDGAEGFCPAVGATGWCVCSDSSTYAIATGSAQPCGFTITPAAGPTTLPTLPNCPSSTVAVQSSIPISSSSTQSAQSNNTLPSSTQSGTAFTTVPPSALPTIGTQATVDGAPTEDVSCPVPNKENTNQYFTPAYVSNNIIDIISKGKKGSYPKEFNKNHGKADQFDWDINNCQTRLDGGENILELPMFLNAAGDETNWSENDSNNRPGAYREYYILKGTVATYCGAYAHTTDAKDSDFAKCT